MLKSKTIAIALVTLALSASSAAAGTLIIELVSGKKPPRDVFAFIPEKCSSRLLKNAQICLASLGF
jgi:hypothetical protein